MSYRFYLFCSLAVLIFCYPTKTAAKTQSVLFDTDQQIATNIYIQLKVTIGDTRKDWPQLQVWSITDRVASFVPADNTIYIDQQALDICKKMGEEFEASLAFIIGHELTHFYQAHDWEISGFASHFMIGKEEFESYRNHERQADIYGAFIAQQAGYNTIKIVPTLLTSIYQSYQLSENANQAYPSLEDRQGLAQEACKLAGDLVAIYQMANYAMVIGKFEEAHHLYTYVSQNLQFKELYFNIGMSNLLQYYYLKEDLPLLYDFKIDPKIPITRNAQTRHPKALLEAAQKAFHFVLQELDETYLPAQQQLLTVYDWKNLPSLFQEQVRLLQSASSKKELPSLQLSRGNFHARNNQKTLALEEYQRILNNFENPVFIRSLAEANSNYLRNGISGKKRSNQHPILHIEKNIDRIGSLSFFNQFDRQISITPILSVQTYESSNSYLSKLQYKNQLMKMQRVYSPSIKSNQGISIGSPASTITSAYPDSELGTIRYTNGYYIVHYQKGLIFKLDDQELVEEWVLFSL